MIRGVKGTLAVLALVGVGLGLRWMTAGSITGVNSHDLDSMTVLAVGTVAWMAYGWLVLAVLVTVLEQLPGAIGALAGAIAGRITSTTARTLLRSSLGVAAVTPLTVGVAHATPADATTRPWTQVEPHSTVQLTSTPTKPSSAVHLAGQAPAPLHAASDTTNWRTTEPGSTVHITGHAPTAHPDAGATQPDTTRPGVDQPGVKQRGTTEPGTTHPGVNRPGVERSGVGRAEDGVPGGGRVRVGVPDRPAVGAATRYTDLRSGVPVRVPGRVDVRAGDSLWSIAARELGPNASAEAIAARWPEWYAANRQVIGSDPDLILPGQVLRIPAAATGQHVPPTHQEK
ncbi:LysM peptidoglycan-binding domain-containing protein [Kribbella sp. NBC_01484]|uniref:LysM peptidoglycan-binding domain-containing protein n=1 Tax=Kribbella sp. NBC_01484 TaxID=2903579 RepID=UPI002E35CE62|nr:LysM peptidoglycan-binding domain-containing protein [Kribbella sp. NBC_01484]